MNFYRTRGPLTVERWVNEIVVNVPYSFAGVSYEAVVEIVGKLIQEFGALVEVPPGSNKYSINEALLFGDFDEMFCQIADEVKKRERSRA
jgi:hypothetical protein